VAEGVRPDGLGDADPTRPWLPVPRRRLDVRLAGIEKADMVLLAPAGVLAQVQRASYFGVCLAKGGRALDRQARSASMRGQELS
jgi:hypothetical protein